MRMEIFTQVYHTPYAKKYNRNDQRRMYNNQDS